jgi:hypothetical protein
MLHAPKGTKPLIKQSIQSGVTTPFGMPKAMLNYFQHSPSIELPNGSIFTIDE